MFKIFLKNGEILYNCKGVKIISKDTFLEVYSQAEEILIVVSKDIVNRIELYTI